MTQPQYEPHDDPDKLRRLYWQAGMTQAEIGRALGVSRTTVGRAMRRHGIEMRNSGGQNGGPPKLSMAKNYPYPRWSVNGRDVYVHQLTAIADGADPYKVFSGGEYHCHHENEIPWDNRPENISLIRREEHMSIHAPAAGDNRKYTDEEMLEWIDLFVEQFGFVPTAKDIIGWPGPCGQTYVKWFGSFTEAVREAGHTPRGDEE